MMSGSGSGFTGRRGEADRHHRADLGGGPVTTISARREGAFTGTARLFSAPAGAGLLAAYAVLVVAAGAALFRRRDLAG